MDNKPGCLSILLNVILVFVTGGIWGVWLIVKYIMSNSK